MERSQTNFFERDPSDGGLGGLGGRVYVQWSPSTGSDGRSVHPRTYEPLQGRPRFIPEGGLLPEFTGRPAPAAGVVVARHAQLMAVSGGLFFRGSLVHAMVSDRLPGALPNK